MRALGGSAVLQAIYKYAYDHQTDIDTKCMQPYFSLPLLSSPLPPPVPPSLTPSPLWYLLILQMLTGSGIMSTRAMYVARFTILVPSLRCLLVVRSPLPSPLSPLPSPLSPLPYSPLPSPLPSPILTTTTEWTITGKLKSRKY